MIYLLDFKDGEKKLEIIMIYLLDFKHCEKKLKIIMIYLLELELNYGLGFI